jgi:carbon monoxide dehydrogenase subunit G
MTWFSATREISAVVTADRERVWSVLSDPAAVAQLTPLVRRIDVDGDHWTWAMEEIPGLGISLAPSFTVLMEEQEPERITFTHDPPEGRRERAGVEGTYLLAEHEQGTRLAMDLAVRVDLPLNRLAKPAVRTAMDGVLAGMGRGFSRNLLDRLDADQVDVG